MSYLSALYFHNEEAAFAYVETRLWPNGPVCPFCGATSERIRRLHGESTRYGVCKCYACRKPFTVRIGTIFESSHLALHLWLQAIYLLSASKKGISTRQLQRMLGVGMKTAWFLTHRIRAAMDENEPLPMGGCDAVVEADETYLGGKRRGQNAKGVQYGAADRLKVVALVERRGHARSFHVDAVTSATIREILVTNVDRKSALMTDEAMHYRYVGREFASHGRVHHAFNEYAKGEISTNTIEGYFAIFKRGMKGIYQHCSYTHLHRYLAEFDFRYNNRIALGIDDVERADNALKGAVGKRLTYRTTH